MKHMILDEDQILNVSNCERTSRRTTFDDLMRMVNE